MTYSPIHNNKENSIVFDANPEYMLKSAKTSTYAADCLNYMISKVRELEAREQSLRRENESLKMENDRAKKEALRKDEEIACLKKELTSVCKYKLIA